MGLKSKFKTWFFLDDDYEDEMIEDAQEQPMTRTNSGKQNVVSFQSIQKQNISSSSGGASKVVLFEPRVYSDAQEIADHLKSRKAVVINLQQIPHDQAKRIVDFLSGTVYAIGGDIQRVGTNIFLCTPDNVEVSGNISDYIHDQNFDDTRW
jgi:cell division inhibitor SepF